MATIRKRRTVKKQKCNKVNRSQKGGWGRAASRLFRRSGSKRKITKTNISAPKKVDMMYNPNKIHNPRKMAILQTELQKLEETSTRTPEENQRLRSLRSEIDLHTQLIRNNYNYNGRGSYVERIFSAIGKQSPFTQREKPANSGYMEIKPD